MMCRSEKHHSFRLRASSGRKSRTCYTRRERSRVITALRMKPFVLDLETAGRDDAAEFLPPVEPPANYKDSAKIEAYLAEKRGRQLETAALSADTARILCVGILRDGHPPLFLHDDDEAALLRTTWHELETRAADEVFTTFNGARFDWPMLARRSFAKGVPVPTWFPRDGRWTSRTHCDLLALWQCGDRAESISLDRLARVLGLPGKTGSGADFARLFGENRPAALAYLENDLKLTREVWLRVVREPA